MATPLTDAINALTTYANTVTGASDQTLSDAVGTLAAGYGGGGANHEAELLSGTYSGEYTNGDVTALKYQAMSNMPNLTKVNLPNLLSVSGNAFHKCSHLTEINVPKLTTMPSNYNFAECPALTRFVAPALTSGLGAFSFQNDTSLATVDLHGGNSFGGQIFSGCTALKTLILRSTTLNPLGNINNFNNTPFASGGTGGTLYVPQSLISSYQSANNWSTILGYANNQIKKIEGSIYETQYADGTPIE